MMPGNIIFYKCIQNLHFDGLHLIAAGVMATTANWAVAVQMGQRCHG